MRGREQAWRRALNSWLPAAVVLGLSAGLSPGPMLALVLRESMDNGIGAGLRVAMAPLLSDGPIVALVAIPFWLVADPAPMLALLSLLGGLYLGYLGIAGLRAVPAVAPEPAQVRGALWRGVVANLLNPNPYLFWLTIGLPLLARLVEHGAAPVVAFVVVFYTGLVGSKMALAWLSGGGRRFFRPRLYLWTLRVLGLALLVYALLFLHAGIDWIVGALA